MNRGNPGQVYRVSTEKTRDDMRVVNIREARAHLARWIAAVEQGEEVIIRRAGRPVARLVPLRKPRKLGVLAGRMTIPEDFDAPLPEKILSAFEGHA